jgi:hypothetical protein
VLVFLTARARVLQLGAAEIVERLEDLAAVALPGSRSEEVPPAYSPR